LYHCVGSYGLCACLDAFAVVWGVSFSHDAQRRRQRDDIIILRAVRSAKNERSR